MCLSVGHIHESYKNGDRDAIWGRTNVGPMIHELDGVELPPWKGSFFWGGGLSGPLKSTGSLCWGYAEKESFSVQ